MVRPGAKTQICDLEIVRTEADLIALVPEWEKLWRGKAEIRASQGPHWCLHSWRTIKQNRRLGLFVVIAKIGGDLVGVVPLLVEDQAGFQVLLNLGLSYDEFSGVLLRDDVDQVAILDEIISDLTERGDIAKISMRNLPDESPLSAAMLSRKLSVTRWTKFRSFIKWDEGDEWEAFLGRTHSKDALQNYARRYRKLVRETGAVFSRERNLDDMVKTVEWIFRNKIENFQARGISSNLTEDLHRKFFVDLASSEDPNNHVAVYSLKTDDRIIAATVAAHGMGTTEGVIVTHDHAYSKFSPGRIVIEQVIMESFGRKEVFDLTWGDHEWKRPWLTGSSSVRHIDLYLSRRASIFLEPWTRCLEFCRQRWYSAHRVLGRVAGKRRAA